eukprot:8526621-Pyramimonas_sp.AAC.1
MVPNKSCGDTPWHARSSRKLRISSPGQNIIFRIQDSWLKELRTGLKRPEGTPIRASRHGGGACTHTHKYMH